MNTRQTTAETILAERLRMADILESPAGLKSPKLARELAFRSSMTAEAALALLANAPSESAFADAMSGEVIGLSPHVNGGANAPTMNARERRTAELEAAAKAVKLAR